MKPEDISKITHLELEKINTHISNLGYQLILLPEVKIFIEKKGFDKEYGARPLKRIIEKFIKNPVSECIISETLKKGNQITLKMNEKKDGVQVIIQKL